MPMPLRSFARMSAILGALALGACADQVGPPNEDTLNLVDDNENRANGEITILLLPTPDGFAQTVHPDYAGQAQWTPEQYLVATPYTYGDTLLENPTLFALDSSFRWQPHGEKAPLVQRGSRGYLSDPDIVAVPGTPELWVYYRRVSSMNAIFLTRSPDGVHFGTPRRVVTAPNHMLVSPAVVRRRSGWQMWTVNAGKEGCRSETTTVEMRSSSDGIAWGAPRTVWLTQPGVSVWHLDVQWIRSRQEYWALYNVKVAGHCATHALYLATSSDGIHWTTYPSPVLEAGVIPEFQSVVYRSSFAYDPRSDNIRFWFSGAAFNGNNFVWRSAYQRRSRGDVFATIARLPSTGIAARRLPPGLAARFIAP